MLLFSTKLFVSPDLSNEIFIKMVIEWINGGKNYTFKQLEWTGEDTFSADNEEKTQHLDIFLYNDSDIVTVHLVNKDDKVIWTNDYVLITKGTQRILSVQLYSEAEDVDAKFPNNFNRPWLLKQIIKRGYGALDNQLPTSDTCTFICNSNIDIIYDIIENNKTYMMPVVYVTSSFVDGKHLVDCVELAKDLAGVAHVLVEKNIEISKELKNMTYGKNPFNGAIQIYYGKNVSTRIIPEYRENINLLRKKVTDSIFGRLILNKMDDDLSLNKIRYSHLNIKNKEFDELSKLSEILLKEAETKLDAAKSKIQELEIEKSRLTNKLNSLQFSYSKKSPEKQRRTSVLLETQEIEYYEGEFNDVILKLVKTEFDRSSDDQNLREKRKYHILSSILQQNIISDTPEKIMNSINNAIKNDGSISNKGLGILQNIGFEVISGDHYKIKYYGDDRYIFTISKTPSDYRTKNNTITTIRNTLFN